MIIAEIGLNHLGSKALAEVYVKQLISANIDGVTLQVREPEYYIKNPHLKFSNYESICKQVHLSNKKFGIAIADINLVDFFEKINVDFYKVIRNDMLNDKLIKKLISTNKKLIISTGTCSEKEIQTFISKYKNANITLNHTQLSYNVEDCNLSAINTLKSKFGVDVSYGNHCINHHVLYMSLCYKPSDILFYVKGSKGFKYPDDHHAIVIDKVSKVVNNLKILNKSIGSGIKNKMEIKIK
tara:strand:+ start:224 stop:943 length:720 start_codon:yes stop_codon:yes gene_type:complete